MKDKSKLTAIILVIITVIVVLISFFTNKENQEESSEINIVKNYSNFYTVNSCLYRTITYISAKDNDSLYLVLDENYKKENNVKKSDVLSLFGIIEGNSTFISKKMYYQRINKNITKYYVYGRVEPNQIFDDGYTTKLPYTDMYFVVYLDTVNKTFSVEPYSGELFVGGDNNE